MHWTLFLVLALAVLAAAILSALLPSLRRCRRGRLLTPYRMVFGGVCLAVFLSLIPVYLSLMADTTDSGLKAVLLALHNTFQVLTLDADRSVATDAVNAAGPRLAPLYSVLLTLAYVCAPILTFGFVASFFKSFTALGRYLLYFRREVFAFSALNERSLALAADLRSGHRKAVLLFAGVSDGGDESGTELLEQAQELKALCFKRSILSVNFALHSTGSPLTLFAMGEDEAENAELALELIRRWKERENTRLLVFSTGPECEMLLSGADKGVMKVRRINEVRSLIDRLLYEEGTALFSGAKAGAEGRKKITAVILGLGRCGTEMLKALAWYGQMDGYTLELHAFDRDELAEERFAALAPDLLSEKYNGVRVPGEAEYTIRIHSGCDVGTRSFLDSLAALGDVTYAFVALGSDRESIRAAVDLRAVCERMKLHPRIHAVVLRAAQDSALDGAVNRSGEPYDIRFIGDLRSSYSEAVILNSRLEAEALERHLKWGREEDFWQYEYYYRSSVASAIHRKARIACGLTGGSPDGEGSGTDEALACLEHRRWNAYMRSEGYVYGDGGRRSDLARTHPDLVDYYSLHEREREKDLRIGND